MTDRKAAKRPERRTVTVAITEGDFAGWEAVALADFPARTLERLQSSDMATVMGAMDSIIVSHNLPDMDGNIAKAMSDVDPYEGAVAIASEVFDAIAKLPPR